MRLCDFLKRIGGHGAHILAVHQHLDDGVPLVRGDGEGHVHILADGDVTGRRDGAVFAGGCFNVVVGVIAVSGSAEQSDFAGQRRVVAIRGGKAPLVVLAGLDFGVAGQYIARVVNPFQHAFRRGEGAADGCQLGVIQRLTTGGDSRVLRLARGGSLRDGDLHLGAGDGIEVHVAVLGGGYLDGADLDGRQNAVFVNGRIAGAADNGVGHRARARAALGAELQRLTVNNGRLAGHIQCRLLILGQGQNHFLGEFRIVAAGDGHRPGDGVILLARDQPVGHHAGIGTYGDRSGVNRSRAGECGVGDAVSPLLTCRKFAVVRGDGLRRQVAVLLTEIVRRQCAACCLSDGQRAEVKLCRLVVGAVRHGCRHLVGARIGGRGLALGVGDVEDARIVHLDSAHAANTRLGCNRHGLGIAVIDRRCREGRGHIKVRRLGIDSVNLPCRCGGAGVVALAADGQRDAVRRVGRLVAAACNLVVGSRNSRCPARQRHGDDVHRLLGAAVGKCGGIQRDCRAAQ